MNDRLLVIGASGLVGSTLTKSARSKYSVFITTNQNSPEFTDLPHIKLDLITNKTKIIDHIKDIKPDYVVHTAAFASVDYCETHQSMADALHIDITKKISSVCKEVNAGLIYISTDAVFDGKSSKLYTENDIPNPISHYGKTKLAAEKIILDSSPNNVILRTTVIYGWHKRSRFTNWVLDSLKNKKIVEAFTDQHNTATLVDDLSNAILKIMKLRVSGLYHAVGRSCISRYEFANLLADRFGYDKNLIISVTANEKKQDAPRPVNGCLEGKKLEKAIDYDFCDIKTGIDLLYDGYLSEIGIK